MSDIPIITRNVPGQARSVRESFDYCRRTAQRQATNFRYGMRLVPEPKRSATYALYAWLRRADDLADAEGDPAEKAHRLEAFWADTEHWIDPANDPADPRDGQPLWPAFRQVAIQYDLPPTLLHEHIQGQLLDQRKTRYATLEELHDYCHKVAAIVGLLCIRIWGHEEDERTMRLARWRGIAFQMTNILRDVREDARLGRVYIPAELHGGLTITPQRLADGADVELTPLIARMADRAAECYAASAGLEERVHPDGRRCLWAMTEVYARLLDRIRSGPEGVLRGPRVRLPRWTKLWIALRALCW